MGENSKNIGDKGEQIVGSFLELIGWKDASKGIEIPCVLSKHEKQTHGIDYQFSYKCPLYAETLENIQISVKYSEDVYPVSENTNYKGLKTKFKDYLEDLAQTIQCFKRSEKRGEIIKPFGGVKRSKETGLLFWINGNKTDVNTSIVDYLLSVRLDSKLVFETVHLVDNKRINEVRKAVKYVHDKYSDESKVYYDYFGTGMNVHTTSRETHGLVMPVQYLTAPIIPFRVVEESNKKILHLVVFDSFDLESLERIFGLCRAYVLEYQAQTIISFPDYQPTQETENAINSIKRKFSNEEQLTDIVVDSYDPDHRNL